MEACFHNGIKNSNNNNKKLIVIFQKNTKLTLLWPDFDCLFFIFASVGSHTKLQNGKINMHIS